MILAQGDGSVQDRLGAGLSAEVGRDGPMVADAAGVGVSVHSHSLSAGSMDTIRESP